MRYRHQNPPSLLTLTTAPQKFKDRYSNQKETLFRDQDLASVFHILGFPFIFEVTGLEKAKRGPSLRGGFRQCRAGGTEGKKIKPSARYT